MHLRIPHLSRMPPARGRSSLPARLIFVSMELQKLPDPTPVRFFRSNRIMLETHDLPELLAQAQFRVGHQ